MTHLAASVQQTAEAARVVAAGVGEAATRRGWTVATAESLTAGTIASLLAAVPGATAWFRGGVLAYAPQVKFDVLGVAPGPVVTEACAAAMATGASRLLGADVCVAATGVGGPEPEEGEMPGTVWLAVTSPAGTRTEKAQLDGDPSEVLSATTALAIRMLEDALTD